MDSKQLYIATGHLSSDVKWDDWIHFGTGNKMKTELVTETVDNFFTGGQINLVHGRQGSGREDKSEIKRRIEGLIGLEDFQLWDESLTKVIEFNKIGILRTGRK